MQLRPQEPQTLALMSLLIVIVLTLRRLFLTPWLPPVDAHTEMTVVVLVVPTGYMGGSRDTVSVLMGGQGT